MGEKASSGLLGVTGLNAEARDVGLDLLPCGVNHRQIGWGVSLLRMRESGLRRAEAPLISRPKIFESEKAPVS